MVPAAELWIFFLMVFGIVILPGLDMAYVLASSLAGGRSSGLAAVAGLVLGGVCHVVAGALGLGLLLKVVPGLYQALLLLGAAYIAWVGVSLVRSRVVLGPLPALGRRSPAATLGGAALTNLSNPKAYLFMLAVFPQFVRPERGPVWLQALPLAVIIALTQAAVYGAVALAAVGSRSWLESRPGAGILAARVVGAVLLLAAVVTGVEGWRGL
ncbi:MAG: LysE family translocator [Thermoanaerobaculia bacterium]|mgnify:CR=1 FL=1